MDTMDVVGVGKGGGSSRGSRGGKKPDLMTLDGADMARIVDPDSECEDSYVFSSSLCIFEGMDDGDEAVPKHEEPRLANWGPLGQRLEVSNPHFSGRPGPTFFGEDIPSPSQQINQQPKSKLYFFRKFFSTECIHRVITQTNLYVDRLRAMPRPQVLDLRYAWPPKWVLDWEALTEAKLMRWLALLLFMSHHPVESEAELWSEHWFHAHPGAHRFMSFEEHRTMRAAVHFQQDQESREDPDTPDPLPKKIGLLMKTIRDNFKLHYSPTELITVEEFPISLASATGLRKTHSPHAGLLMRGLGCISFGRKYIYDIDLQSSDSTHPQLAKGVTRLVRGLQRGAGHKIFISSRCSSVALFSEVAAMGHYCCGELAPGRGGPPSIMQLRGRGPGAGKEWEFAMSREGSLSAYAWPATNAGTYLSNFHPPDEANTELKRRLLHSRPWSAAVKSPTAVAEYTMLMESELALSGPGHAANPLCTGGAHKWYHALFWLLLECCASNAHFLWWERQGGQGGMEAEGGLGRGGVEGDGSGESASRGSVLASRTEYVAGLCDEILSLYSASGRGEAAAGVAGVEVAGGGEGRDGRGAGGEGAGGSGSEGGRKGPKKRARCVSSEVRASHRRLTERHFIQTADKKRNCVLCYHCCPNKSGELQVHHWCAQCGVHLHVDCFEEWHTRLDPRSRRVGPNSARDPAPSPATRPAAASPTSAKALAAAATAAVPPPPPPSAAAAPAAPAEDRPDDSTATLAPPPL